MAEHGRRLGKLRDCDRKDGLRRAPVVLTTIDEHLAHGCEWKEPKKQESEYSKR